MKFLIALLLCGYSSLSFCDEKVVHDSYNPFTHMWDGTKDMFKADNLPLLLWGSGATAVSMMFFDNSVKTYFAGHHRLGGTEVIGNDYLGTGLVGGTIAIVTLMQGLIMHNDKSINAGEAHGEALVANLAYTSSFKLFAHRERPDGSDYYSFPSGHASTMFCSTAVLMDFYGPYVGYPFMVLAVFTGVGRLASNRHYLSDVIFGSTLGYIVGTSYTQHHLAKLAGKQTDFSILPYYEDHQAGLTATLVF